MKSSFIQKKKKDLGGNMKAIEFTIVCMFAPGFMRIY